MSIKFNSKKTKLTALSIIMGVFSLSGLLAVAPPIPAEAAPGNTCTNVVERAACEKEVADAKCSNAACIRSIVQKSKYHPVYSVCKDKADPQKCHKDVKAQCNGKTGAVLTKCKETEAKKSAKATASTGTAFSLAAKGEKKFQCGTGEQAVQTRFDFGCLGESADGEMGPIEDAAYAIMRFLSYGVGLVIAASIIYAGIQYSSSEGNPETTQAAKKRIQNGITALIFYIFIFALAQYLIPGGLFQ